MRTLLLLSILAAYPLQAGENPVPKKSTEVSPVVTVGGQVRRPGPIESRKALTLWAAIQQAGGATEFGSMRRVKVIRDGNSTVHDLSNDEEKMLAVEPGDLVEVPQKNLFGR